MTPAQAQAILDTLTELKQYAGLSHKQIALQADARRALGIPTKERATLAGEERLTVTPFLPASYADMDSISGGFR